MIGKHLNKQVKHNTVLTCLYVKHVILLFIKVY